MTAKQFMDESMALEHREILSKSTVRKISQTVIDCQLTDVKDLASSGANQGHKPLGARHRSPSAGMRPAISGGLDGAMNGDELSQRPSRFTSYRGSQQPVADLDHQLGNFDVGTDANARHQGAQHGSNSAAWVTGPLCGNSALEGCQKTLWTWRLCKQKLAKSKELYVPASGLLHVIGSDQKTAADELGWMVGKIVGIVEHIGGRGDSPMAAYN